MWRLLKDPLVTIKKNDGNSMSMGSPPIRRTSCETDNIGLNLMNDPRFLIVNEKTAAQVKLEQTQAVESSRTHMIGSPIPNYR